MDRPLIVISILLLATVVLFLLDIFPYPFGVIVLSVFLVSRLIMLSGKKQERK